MKGDGFSMIVILIHNFGQKLFFLEKKITTPQFFVLILNSNSGLRIKLKLLELVTVLRGDWRSGRWSSIRVCTAGGGLGGWCAVPKGEMK
jgi:hypothetical protein